MEDIPDTSSPTVTPMVPCNICGDNMMVGDPTGIIVLGGVELTCAEAEMTVEFGNISEGACQVLQDAATLPCDCQGICNVCGDDGLMIGNPGGFISVDGLDFTCAEAQSAADEGSVSEGACEVLQDSADNCDCLVPNLPTPSPSPSPGFSKKSKKSKKSKVSSTMEFMFTWKQHPSFTESQLSLSLSQF
jgi:hypothetical protein